RPDPAVMRLDDLFGDGEAEASAAHLAGTAFIDAIEPLEYAVHLASGDAASVIFGLYRHTVVVPVVVGVGFVSLVLAVGIFDCVGNDIVQHLSDLVHRDFGEYGRVGNSPDRLDIIFMCQFKAVDDPI